MSRGFQFKTLNGTEPAETMSLLVIEYSSLRKRTLGSGRLDLMMSIS